MTYRIAYGTSGTPASAAMALPRIKSGASGVGAVDQNFAGGGGNCDQNRAGREENGGSEFLATFEFWPKPPAGAGGYRRGGRASARQFLFQQVGCINPGFNPGAMHHCGAQTVHCALHPELAEGRLNAPYLLLAPAPDNRRRRGA